MDRLELREKKPSGLKLKSLARAAWYLVVCDNTAARYLQQVAQNEEGGPICESCRMYV